MKLWHKITLFFIVLVGFYYVLVPKNNYISEREIPIEIPDKLVNLKILKDQFYFPFYEFQLIENENEYEFQTVFDSVNNQYYFNREGISIGDYELKIIPFFDSSISVKFSLTNDSTFDLDTSFYKEYKITEKSNFLYEALKNRDPIKISFRESSCYSRSRVRYSFFHSKNKEIIHRLENGSKTDSMSFDSSIFRSKLRKLISAKENPVKKYSKFITNKNGDEIYQIEYLSIAGQNLSLDIESNNEVYTINLSDFFNSKDRKFFESFCNSFFEPKMEMKI